MKTCFQFGSAETSYIRVNKYTELYVQNSYLHKFLCIDKPGTGSKVFASPCFFRKEEILLQLVSEKEHLQCITFKHKNL